MPPPPPRLLSLLLPSLGACREISTRAGKMRLRMGAPNNESDEKAILFVRHAEGWHNKDERELANWHADQLGLTEAYRDARLTPDGENQCAALKQRLEEDPAFVPPDVVVVSPLTRAIQTASLTFEKGPFPFVATELARERVAAHTCDQRSRLSDLERAHPRVDFGFLESEDDVLWHDKEDHPSELDSTKCKARALDFLAWLWHRPEKRLAVVSHWVFLEHLFSHFPDDPDLQARFKNAELREVALEVIDDDDANRLSPDL